MDGGLGVTVGRRAGASGDNMWTAGQVVPRCGRMQGAGARFLGTWDGWHERGSRTKLWRTTDLRGWLRRRVRARKGIFREAGRKAGRGPSSRSRRAWRFLALHTSERAVRRDGVGASGHSPLPESRQDNRDWSKLRSPRKATVPRRKA